MESNFNYQGISDYHKDFESAIDNQISALNSEISALESLKSSLQSALDRVDDDEPGAAATKVAIRADIQKCDAEISEKKEQISALETTKRETTTFINDLIEKIKTSDLDHGKMLEMIMEQYQGYADKMDGMNNQIISDFKLDKSLLEGVVQGKAWSVVKSNINFLGDKNDSIAKRLISGKIIDMSTSFEGAAASVSWSFLGANFDLNAFYVNAKADFEFTIQHVKLALEAKVAVVQASVEFEKELMEGLTIGINAEGALLTARAEMDVDIGWDKDGKLNVKLSAEAMAALAEGKISSKINVFDLFELELGAEGYAGAIGAKGEIGIKEGEFKAGASVAAGVGGGFWIGIKPSGIVKDIIKFLGMDTSAGTYKQETETVTYEYKSTTNTNNTSTKGGNSKTVKNKDTTSTTYENGVKKTETNNKGNKSTTYEEGQNATQTTSHKRNTTVEKDGQTHTSQNGETKRNPTTTTGTTTNSGKVQPSKKDEEEN